MITVSIDGVLVAPEAATISVFDRGLLYGDGLFEVLRTWRGVLVELDAHLARLYASAGALELRAMERGALAEATRRTVAAAGAGEHRVRIMLTRGPGPLATPLADLDRGCAIVIVEPLPPQPTALALAVVDFPLPRRAGAGHKALAYLDHVIARELAAAAGADEAVRLDGNGAVVECATANVFAVIGGVVTTPPVDAGVLAGITRARVLARCARDGMATATRSFSVGELRAAEEIFVTSSLRGVIGVTRLDALPREVGPVTTRIIAAYLQEMAGAI